MKHSATEMPYEVNGQIYHPLQSSENFSETGIASWYGPDFHKKLTSNKEVYNMNSMTAAHKTLPFGTQVRVTNLENGREAVVRINDRGPFARKRIIDLSRKAAEELDIVREGTARVKLKVLYHPENKRTVVSKGPFTVQVAALQNAETANLVKNQLENSRIKPYLNGDKETYRVTIGNYSDFEDAVELRNRVRKSGFPDAFIIILDN